ncbi:MAG: TonB family protein [Bacteroidetes bacterium]|nr:TonB family protein [Bacteroidota bacterium]MBX7046142.1 TonB family protein [Ignavibacteria bacterium]
MAAANTEQQVKPLGRMIYGAPELIALYQKYAMRGLMIAILFAFVLIGSVFAYNKIKANIEAEKENQQRLVTLQDLDLPPPTSEETPPPPEPEIPEKIALKDLEALVPEPVAKEKAEILTTKTQEKLEEVKVPVASTGTDDPTKVTWDGTGKLEQKKVEQKVETKEVKKEEKKKDFQSFEVEKAPVAVNLGSVRGSMKYPEIARSAGIEGTCVAKILVGTSGEIIKVSSISGPDVFHSEIQDKIMNLQFTPALQGGQPVRCYVNVPFKFSLGTKKKTDDDDKDKKDDK